MNRESFSLTFAKSQPEHSSEGAGSSEAKSFRLLGSPHYRCSPSDLSLQEKSVSILLRHLLLFSQTCTQQNVILANSPKFTCAASPPCGSGTGLRLWISEPHPGVLHFGLKGAGPGDWLSGEGQDFRGSSGKACTPHVTCGGGDLRGVSVPNKQVGLSPGCPASMPSPLASQGFCFSCLSNKEVIRRSPGV